MFNQKKQGFDAGRFKNFPAPAVRSDFNYCHTPSSSPDEFPTQHTSGPGQLNMSEGVTACIALASSGGVAGSSFTASRLLPRL
jgi:hypothetical protein